MMISLFKIDIGRRTAKLLEVGTVFMIACLVILVFPLCLGCQKSQYTHNVNYSSLLGYSNFDVSAEEIGTSTHGTILVSQSKPNELDIKIVASVVIAPGDWFGVRIAFPRGCYIEDILCTHMDNNRPESDSFWLHDFTKLGSKYGVEFGVGSFSPSETISGGTGTVFIHSVLPIDIENRNAEVEFGIYIGSKKVDAGFWIVGEAYEIIVVQIECQ